MQAQRVIGPRLGSLDQQVEPPALGIGDGGETPTCHWLAVCVDLDAGEVGSTGRVAAQVKDDRSRVVGGRLPDYLDGA